MAEKLQMDPGPALHGRPEGSREPLRHPGHARQRHWRPLAGPAGDPEGKFSEPTGRFGFDWKPQTGFTNETLVYGFYSRGYKAGGLNPAFSPGIGIVPINPTFKPEFIDSFEVGSKNTLLDGTLQVNLTGFYYDYQGYQVSKIINRTSINENIDAEVYGAEFESIWQPIEGLRSQRADRLPRHQDQERQLDRHLQPHAEQREPDAGQVERGLELRGDDDGGGDGARHRQRDQPVQHPRRLHPDVGGGLGHGHRRRGDRGRHQRLWRPGVGRLPVDLSGNQLPNAPHWTVSLAPSTPGRSATGTPPCAATTTTSPRPYARIYNSEPDRIHAWDNVNLTLTVANKDLGVEVGGFVKNLTKEKAVTDFY
jgi:outer membrane receptor protein involved in Fe transport